MMKGFELALNANRNMIVIRGLECITRYESDRVVFYQNVVMSIRTTHTEVLFAP